MRIGIVVIAIIVAHDVMSGAADTSRHGHLRVPVPIAVIVEIAGDCRIGAVSIAIALIATAGATRPWAIFRRKSAIPAAIASAGAAGRRVAALALDVLRSRFILTGIGHALLALPTIAVSTAEVCVIRHAGAVANPVSGATNRRRTTVCEAGEVPRAIGVGATTTGRHRNAYGRSGAEHVATLAFGPGAGIGHTRKMARAVGVVTTGPSAGRYTRRATLAVLRDAGRRGAAVEDAGEMTAAITIGTATGRGNAVAAARFRAGAAGVRARMSPGVALTDVSGGRCAVAVFATGRAGDTRGAAELNDRWTRVFAGVAG